MTVDVAADITAAETSHAALLHTIDELTDADVRAPSLLPAWSRGHVLTHLARNADGLLNLLTWARTGERTPMYESRDKRSSDIEDGSGRPAAAIVDDLLASQQRWADAARQMLTEEWKSEVAFGKDDTVAPVSIVPALRIGEIEVHHVDLGLDYTPAHWAESFVEGLLDRVAGDFTGRDGVPGVRLHSVEEDKSWTIGDGATEVSGPAPALLAWAIGRTDGAGLHVDGGILPTLGTWR